MLREPKQFCLKNWDLDVNWEAWSIMKNDNTGEDGQLFFLTAGGDKCT